LAAQHVAMAFHGALGKMLSRLATTAVDTFGAFNVSQHSPLASDNLWASKLRCDAHTSAWDCMFGKADYTRGLERSSSLGSADGAEVHLPPRSEDCTGSLRIDMVALVTHAWVCNGIRQSPMLAAGPCPHSKAPYPSTHRHGYELKAGSRGARVSVHIRMGDHCDVLE